MYICVNFHTMKKNVKKELYRKNLNLDPEFGDMIKEMSTATVRNETDMIAFCIKEYYTKTFKADH